MKKLLFLGVIGLFALFVSAKNTSATSAEMIANDTPRMKQYWLVMLLKGNNRTHNKTTAQRI
jgi:hypothetical protein